MPLLNNAKVAKADLLIKTVAARKVPFKVVKFTQIPLYVKNARLITTRLLWVENRIATQYLSK